MNNSPRYAGFWMRFLATLIDLVILLPLLTFFLVSVYGTSYFLDARLIKGFWDVFIQIVIPGTLSVVLWKYVLATPGKLVLGLQVVDAKTLQALSVWQSVIRYFAYSVSMLPLCIGFIWIAFDPRKQGLHDKLAGSVVIHKSEKEEAKGD